MARTTNLLTPLDIQPIRNLKYYSSVLRGEIAAGIIIGVDNKYVRHWFVSPLEPTINAEVFSLSVVLQE